MCYIIDMDEKIFLEKVEEINGTAYVVGGWVRDMLLGCEPYDKDYVVCNVNECEFTEQFPEAKKVGNSFPVFLVQIGSEMCDVALARRESKSGIGHLGFTVMYGADVTIEEDLYRRDTTINSMAWSPAKGDFVDPYGGKQDIRNRVIRATSEHFAEDSLRALRAARQAAQFGFVIEPKTLEMMRQCSAELINEPKERVIAETKKALESDRPSIFFCSLKDTGLLGVIFPWIYNLIGKTRHAECPLEGDAFEHTMMLIDRVSKVNKRVEVRFAALMYDIGEEIASADAHPNHYGHEINGLIVLREMNRVMPLPKRWYSCAAFAIKKHIRQDKMNDPEKVVDFLLGLEKSAIGFDGFSAIIESENYGERADYLVNYEKYMQAIQSARGLEIPAQLKGIQIAEWVRQQEIEAYIKASRQEGFDC